MESRMKKYYTEEFKQDAKRTNKNAGIYKDSYGNYVNEDKLPVSSNEMEITDINKVVTTREEYRRMKRYEAINSEEKDNIVKQEDVPEKKVSKAKRIYDINVLLAKAKEEINNLDEETNNTNKYLQTLQTDEEIKTDLEKVKEMYNEIEKEYEEEKELEELNTQNLSLELLNDLKSEGNTEVTPPLVEEEIIREADETIAHKIEPHDEEEKFYSDSYKFSKEDFSEDEDFYDGEISKGSYALKVILLIIGITALTVLVLFFLDYYNIVNVIPKGE